MLINGRKVPKVTSGLWWSEIYTIKIFQYLQVTVLIAEAGFHESWWFDKSQASVVKKVWRNFSIKHLTLIHQGIVIR